MVWCLQTTLAAALHHPSLKEKPMHIRSIRSEAAAFSSPRRRWRRLGANAFIVLAGTVVLGACSQERAQSTTTPGLETGITSSSGGSMANGMRPLGNTTFSK